MSDVSRNIVPDKGSLNKDRQVTKPLVSVLHKKELFFSSELEWNVREGVHTERHDNRYDTGKSLNL